MSVTVKFDSSRFQKAFRDRVARSKKTLPEITNTVAYFVAKTAMDNTKRADKQEIEALGVMGYQVLKLGKKDKETGKLIAQGFLKKFKAIYDQDGPIRAIFVSILLKAGKNPRSFGAGEIGQGAIKLLARRMKSIGFLASGWIPSLNKLSKINGYGSAKSGIQTWGKPKGGIKLAVDGWSPKCELWNSTMAHSTAQEPASQQRMAGHLQAALSDSFNSHAADMEKKTAEALNKVWQS